MVVQAPVRGSARGFEQWSWDGAWSREATSAIEDDPTTTVDLRTLDVEALFDNIEIAKSDLGVSNAEVQRVVVRRAPDEPGSVTIHVRNGLTDSALLETTTQGTRVRSVPFDG